MRCCFRRWCRRATSERFTLGLVTSSGSLGLLFAPSLPLIIYGIIAEVSIDELFVAGVVPGVLMMLVLAGFCVWRNRANRRPDWRSFPGVRFGQAARESVWELPLPVVVLGGIYSGLFAVSEAAAVTVVYVLIVETADLPGGARCADCPVSSATRWCWLAASC